MAVLYMEGFDTCRSLTNASLISELVLHGVPAVNGGSNGASHSSSLTTGRYGRGKCLKLDATWQNAYTRLTFPIGSQAVGSVGVSLKLDSTALGYQQLSLITAAGSLMVTYTNASTLTVTYNPAGEDNDLNVAVAIPTSPIYWHHLEVVWGAYGIELWYNNRKLYTSAISFDPVTSVRLGNIGNTTTTRRAWYIDDIYITDSATAVGEVEVAGLTLDSTVSNTGTVTGASAEAALSTTDGDTSYITYDTVGQETTLTLSDLPAGTISVEGVRVAFSGRKDDTEFPEMEVALTTGSKNVVLDEAVSGGYVFYPAVLDSDPDGGGWTEAKINAMTVSVTRSV